MLWRRRKPKCKSVAAQTTKLSQQGGEATREDNEGSNKEEEDEDEDEDEDEVFQQGMVFIRLPLIGWFIGLVG